MTNPDSDGLRQSFVRETLTIMLPKQSIGRYWSGLENSGNFHSPTCKSNHTLWHLVQQNNSETHTHLHHCTTFRDEIVTLRVKKCNYSFYQEWEEWLVLGNIELKIFKGSMWQCLLNNNFYVRREIFVLGFLLTTVIRRIYDTFSSIRVTTLLQIGL